MAGVLLSGGKQVILCSETVWLTLSRVHAWNLIFRVGL